MAGSHTNRRPYGGGSVYVKQGAYYGRWRTHGRQVTGSSDPSANQDHATD